MSFAAKGVVGASPIIDSKYAIKTIKNYSNSPRIVADFASQIPLLAVFDMGHLDWITPDIYSDQKINIVQKKTREETICAHFRPDSQVLLSLSRSNRINIINTRSKDILTYVQIDRDLKIVDFFVPENFLNYLIICDSNFQKAQFIDTLKPSEPIKEYDLKNNDIYLEPNYLFKMEETPSSVLFGVCQANLCSLIDTRLESEMALQFNVGVDEILKNSKALATSLNSPFKIGFTVDNVYYNYDIRNLKSSTSLGFSSPAKSLTLLETRQGKQVVIVLMDGSVCFVDINSLDINDMWKSKNHICSTFISKNKEYGFTFDEEGILSLRYDIGESKKLHKEKQIINVSGFEMIQPSAKNVDTVFDSRNELKKFNENEGKVNFLLRKFRHTEALETCLRQKNSDKSILYLLIEELVRRNVLENVIATIDLESIKKLLTIATEYLSKRNSIELVSHCIMLIIDLRKNEICKLKDEMTRIDKWMKSRRVYYLLSEEVIQQIESIV